MEIFNEEFGVGVKDKDFLGFGDFDNVWIEDFFFSSFICFNCFVLIILNIFSMKLLKLI